MCRYGHDAVVVGSNEKEERVRKEKIAGGTRSNQNKMRKHGATNVLKSRGLGGEERHNEAGCEMECMKGAEQDTAWSGLPKKNIKPEVLLQTPIRPADRSDSAVKPREGVPSSAAVPTKHARHGRRIRT